MELILNNNKTEYFEIISPQDLVNIHTILKRFTSLKGPLRATIYSINELLLFSLFEKLLFSESIFS